MDFDIDIEYGYPRVILFAVAILKSVIIMIGSFYLIETFGPSNYVFINILIGSIVIGVIYGAISIGLYFGLGESIVEVIEDETILFKFFIIEISLCIIFIPILLFTSFTYLSITLISWAVLTLINFIMLPIKSNFEKSRVVFTILGLFALLGSILGILIQLFTILNLTIQISTGVGIAISQLGLTR